MPPSRPPTARRVLATTLAGGSALVALLLMSGCDGDKSRREPVNPFIGPSGAATSQPFGALPVEHGDGRLAER